MLHPRLIPCLLIHKGGLVKTVGFRSPQYVGDPINAVRIFNEKRADELAIFDIDASVQNLEPNFFMIARIASECKMPLCYGGGIKNVEQAKRIIGLGVEKIAISSAFIERPQIISEIAHELGRQSVVVVLDVKKSSSDEIYEVHIKNGQVNTNQNLYEAVIEAERLGAGEIVVNSIDQDGVMKGYDLTLAKKVRELVNVPITMLGGAGRLDDIKALVHACGVVGASAGSLFVFKGVYKAVLINYPSVEKKDKIFERELG